MEQFLAWTAVLAFVALAARLMMYLDDRFQPHIWDEDIVDYVDRSAW